MSTCYGTACYGKLEKCHHCELKDYCTDAADPQSYAIEYNDALGQPTSDPLPWDEIDEEPVSLSPKQILQMEVSSLLREFFREAVRITNADPVRIYILVGKLGGLSHSSIGRSCGMTKQAISKHCQEIERRSLFLGNFLKMKFACDEDLAKNFAEFSRDIRRNNGRRVDLQLPT